MGLFETFEQSYKSGYMYLVAGHQKIFNNLCV